VTFSSAYCTYPLCVPSRISTLTGMYPSYSGYVGNKPYMEDKHDSLFGRAKEAGHRTMLVGKDHAYGPASIGGEKGNHPEFMDGIFDRMYCALHNDFQPPEIERDLPHVRPWLAGNEELHRLWGSDIAPWTSEKSVTARLCDVAVEYLEDWHREDRPQGVPFAMWLSIPDPHELYQAPRDVVESIPPDSIEMPPNWDSDMEKRSGYMKFMHWYFNSGGVPASTVKKLIRVYLAMCKNVDIQLNKVLNALERLGLREDTLIIFTSDHGDFNGEHGLLQKFNCGYDGCCRVPLLISWAGTSKAGRVCEDPVSLVDIPSTVCNLMGWKALEQDQGSPMTDIVTSDHYDERDHAVVECGVPGESLTEKDIHKFPNHRWDVQPVGRWCYDPPHRFGGKMYALRTRDYKLIVRQDQGAEFYDMKQDPWETRNVFDEPEYGPQILRHYQHLSDHLCRIAHERPDVYIERQDAWYRAGGSRTWEESVPPEIRQKARS